MIIRCTRKVLDQLPPDTPLADPPPDTGDWYLNLLWIERRKCLLLVHAGTLFAVLRPAIRKADLRDLPTLVAAMLGQELEHEGLPHNTYGPLPPPATVIAKTADRRTLGHMNEIAFHLHHLISRGDGLNHTDLDEVHHHLHRTLHNHHGNYIRPIDLAAAASRSR